VQHNNSSILISLALSRYLVRYCSTVLGSLKSETSLLGGVYFKDLGLLTLFRVVLMVPNTYTAQVVVF
jgi:hypothetical protein